MERKGVYNKGRAGHVRNVNSFVAARQHLKKYRLPFVVIFALLFVFGITPIVGENFHASVLMDAQNTTVKTMEASAVDYETVELCKNELRDITNNLMQNNESLQRFLDANAGHFAGMNFENRASLLNEAVETLAAFVQSCAEM